MQKQVIKSSTKNSETRCESVMNPFRVQATQQPVTHYTLFINGALEDHEQVEDIITALDIAEEHDFITVHLSSPGGNVDVGNSIIFAMNRCKAHIHVCGAGSICSMAPFILFEADSFEIEPYASLMFHSISFGNFAEGVDVEKYAKFVNKKARQMFEERLTGFFSQEEIDGILIRKDEIWMAAEEFCSRFEKRQEYLASQQEQCVDRETEEPSSVPAYDQIGSYPSEEEMEELASISESVKKSCNCISCSCSE